MIFGSPLFTDVVLPFLLVFVVMFAILQKSKVLGDGKAQIDALVALAIALILIGVPQARQIVVDLMPWLAVGVAVILVFLILYGFVAGDLTTAPLWMKRTFGILAGLFTIGIVLFVTGLWRVLLGWFNFEGESGGFLMNAIVVIIVVGVVVVAVATGKKEEKGKGKKEG